LVPYRTELQDIRLTVYRHQQNPQRSWYEVRGVIHLPTGTLAAEANDKDPRAALDRVTDELAAEIKRHKEHVRKDYVYKRKSRRRAGLKAVGPLLQRDAEAGRREDFFRLLRPQLRVLRDQARRELRILELQGVFHRGEVTVADLLDEVLIRAWQRFADRPRHLSLDLWLTDLLHDTLEQWIKQEPRPHVSLEEKAGEPRPDEAPQVGEQEWWAALLGDVEETFTLEDLIPDTKAAEVWDELEAEEQRERLLSLLGGLPASQRQAFLLYALEDYDPAEIAMLQDRPESEVKADIEAVRQMLRDRLLAGEPVRKERS
jgi:RNA polymerase sigma factor (sigma-70 family)